LFAYEDDVKKFELSPAEGYIISRKKIAWFLDVAPTTQAIKYQLEQAGFVREYTNEGRRQLKLKNTDVLKILKRKMKKKLKE